MAWCRISDTEGSSCRQGALLAQEQVDRALTQLGDLGRWLRMPLRDVGEHGAPARVGLEALSSSFDLTDPDGRLVAFPGSHISALLVAAPSERLDAFKLGRYFSESVPLPVDNSRETLGDHGQR